MDSVAIFAGLDYHQDSVQVCVLDGQGKRLVNRAVPNDARRVAELVTSYGRPVRVAIEAFCRAARAVERDQGQIARLEKRIAVDAAG